MSEKVGFETARVKAVKEIRRIEVEAGIPISFFSGEFGIPESEDYGDVWIFNWNSVSYIKSGHIFDQLLAGPIAVPKNGEGVFVMGTARSVVEELDQWRDLRSKWSQDSE